MGLGLAGGGHRRPRRRGRGACEGEAAAVFTPNATTSLAPRLLDPQLQRPPQTIGSVNGTWHRRMSLVVLMGSIELLQTESRPCFWGWGGASAGFTVKKELQIRAQRVTSVEIRNEIFSGTNASKVEKLGVLCVGT